MVKKDVLKIALYLKKIIRVIKLKCRSVEKNNQSNC